MQAPNGVGPALFQQPLIRLARRGLQQGVLFPGRRVVDVEIGGHDIEVATEHHRLLRPIQRLRMRVQPLEPLQLVVELRPRLRIAVRQVNARDTQPVNVRLDVPTVCVIRIAGQAAADLYRLDASGENRHAVPRQLPMPDAAIPDIAKRGCRKTIVRRLQLLQTSDVGCFPLQPLEKIREAAADTVDVERADFHARLSGMSELSHITRHFSPLRPSRTRCNHGPVWQESWQEGETCDARA
jgi:hypothetical protein